MPRKERTGLVVSDKMDKTRVIKIVEKVQHAKYGKVQTKTVKYKFHDETNDAKMGDTVRIIESRLYSKDKCWALKAIIKRSEED